MVTVTNLRFRKADVDVTRKGPYGNPYTHLAYGRAGIKVKDRDAAINYFAEFWYSEKARPLRKRALREIPTNGTVGCVCAPLRCHAEIIAGYINWKVKEYADSVRRQS